MKHFLHSLDKIMMVPRVEMRNMYLPMQINFEFFACEERTELFRYHAYGGTKLTS